MKLNECLFGFFHVLCHSGDFVLQGLFLHFLVDLDIGLELFDLLILLHDFLFLLLFFLILVKNNRAFGEKITFCFWMLVSLLRCFNVVISSAFFLVSCIFFRAFFSSFSRRAILLAKSLASSSIFLRAFLASSNL